MKIILGIIAFHILVLLIGRVADDRKKGPYIFVLLITLLLTGFVTYMLFNMDYPDY